MNCHLHPICVWIAPIFLLGCHNHTQISQPAKDSTTIAISPYKSKTVDTPKKATVPADSYNAKGGEDELKSYYDEYIASYTQPCVIDSSFRLGSSRFTIHLEDTCLMDNAIIVPKKYVNMYKLDSFVTHTFRSRVRLEKDGRSILDRVIVRQDFDPLLFEALQHYANIRCPDIRLRRDSIFVEYSISIPLTDVGSLEYAVIDTTGNIRFRQPLPED